MTADVQLLITADGSHTAVNQTLDKTYHSIHGALQESKRVFIELGLQAAFEIFPVATLRIFEMGFGTGLNALLTAKEAVTNKRQIEYTAVEAYPMAVQDAQQLNFDTLLGTNYLANLHESPWETLVDINPYFQLTKVQGKLEDFWPEAQYHLIYFDAFAPTAQPELWEADIFRKMTQFLLPNGMLTTYCSKSYVQRNMRAAGLTVEKHPGPPHKRDIIRAIRNVAD
ncbi:tRNA (5-methylaminomethyl-2-thiouridine)(34)-methyltransferase MnmD [Spirosoma sp. BT702]|uniref:tRNA (5-methylaminomethyl-2-thiouridine)(34)-methyltransferase MnmD n=1 Tax=Spirosoma profusum TaxID=2771354 RepID=A0A926XZY7_9BACT|nr:tRNA (5-methylaminomethyl-2-thiouridine)(34)-methyltransferase MnmD [Spirosoma profusum]MBD2700968.1 tRNA (5-methylaminomethyl-2-thiouridine)(34)-methyltransferase MnmD [Spirosoma profusum]